MHKDLIAKITFGDLRVELIAQNVGWNPDIADDLTARMKIMWKDALVAMQETGTWEDSVEYEDE